MGFSTRAMGLIKGRDKADEEKGGRAEGREHPTASASGKDQA